ncbi:hypothetical protein BS50DRAFT_679130 [Corynespora cassiicola Philippines]|uniref:BTB domain-containing protein n=1 Tax=Corynespora cassiicola Philippines TaxID=1448308 RepID=A0A2T2NES5_CORCC|nr:hypothetical protein BS50DRAFT_679130 [Corynespora cassiicola Philippines]
MAISDCTVPARVADGIEFIIAKDGDFIIQITPPKAPLTERPSNLQASTKRLLRFRVSKDVLKAQSTVFEDILRVQPNLTNISFENQGISHALEVWLRVLHGQTEAMPDNLMATRERVWAAIAVRDEFGFHAHNPAAVNDWFKAYYDDTMTNGPGLTPMVARSLVFPSIHFDHAEGFMKLTKYLVYHTTGTFIVHNPSAFTGLTTNARFLDGPLTAARAELQSTIEHSINLPLEKLHQAHCVCRKETAFDYEDALRAVGCWPLSRAFKANTIAEVVEKLSGFKFISKNANKCSSGMCSRDFGKDIDIAISKGKKAFQGLCLDCMNRSTLAANQPKEAYVEDNSPYNGCWDMGCRYGHYFMTWHLSWMGTSSMHKSIVDKFRSDQVSKPHNATPRTNMSSRGRGPAPRGRIRNTNIHINGTNDIVPSTGKNLHPGHSNGEDSDPEEDEFFDAETYMNSVVLDHDDTEE